MFFEHHTEPMATQAEFARRMLRFGLFVAGIILFSLCIGILGYHYFESLSWIDSLLNASMILGGWGRSIRCGQVPGRSSLPFMHCIRGLSCSLPPVYLLRRSFIVSCIVSTWSLKTINHGFAAFK